MKKKTEPFFEFKDLQLSIRIHINKLILGVVLVAFVLALPYLCMEKPQITTVTPNKIIAGSAFNADMSLVLEGQNLQHIIGVFVDGVWEPDCGIAYIDETHIKINLPWNYYNTPHKYTIQVQTRVNSDLTAMSKGVKFHVYDVETVAVPVISEVTIRSTGLEASLVKEIEIKGENLSEKSRLHIEGQSIYSEFENGNLVGYIPIDMLEGKQSLKIQIEAAFEGVATQVMSDEYVYDLLDEADIADTNEGGIVDYLNALAGTDYIVVLSVADEASVAMTQEVVDAMNRLGLREDLRGKLRYSYAAILDSGDVLFEEMSESAIETAVHLQGNDICVQSAGLLAGNYSMIQINGVEYSKNRRGINIVVYDKEKEKVLDSVCFDTYDGISVYR